MNTYEKKKTLPTFLGLILLTFFVSLMFAKTAMAQEYKWPMKDAGHTANGYRGTINPAADVDYYQFTLTKKSSVTINYKAMSLKNSQVALLSGNKQKAYKAYNLKNSSISDPKKVTIKYTLEKGTYYLRIKSLDSGTGTYLFNGYYAPVTKTKPAAVKVKKITLSGNKRLAAGGKFTLKAAVTPSNATNRAVKWTSSNPSVATVSSTGKVVTKKAGTTVIRATAKDGSKVSRACTVIVHPKKMTVSTPFQPKNGIITVNWTSQPGVTGYQLRVTKLGYNNTKSTVKTVTVTNPGAHGVTFKTFGDGLYTIQVRAYVTVNQKKYAGKYSEIKKLYAR